MARKNYIVDEDKKIVIVNAEKLTAEEKTVVKTLQELFDYKLVNKASIDKKKKEEHKTNPAFTFAAIQKFLEENATEKQKKEYWELYNKPVFDKDGNKLFYLHDSKDGKHKKGDARVVGHVGTLTWLSENFEQYKDIKGKKTKQ